MSKVGFIGLGKLGLPVALSMGLTHDVMGYDIVPPKVPVSPDMDEGIMDVVENSKMLCTTRLESVVAHTDGLVFIAVQTPHSPMYDGSLPLDPDVVPVDFEYAYLATAVRSVVEEAMAQEKVLTIVVISTVLPGTIENVVKPLVPNDFGLVYNPYFTAMGTTCKDFMNPEFVLVGTDDDGAALVMTNFYDKVYDNHNVQLLFVSIADAELVKMAYNTFIGLKLVFANTIMEIAHKTAADCDVVLDVLLHADRRLFGPRYFSGGMGDGGPCHPRDQLALAHLADKLGLSYNLFHELMLARQDQTMWLVDLAEHWQRLTHLPVRIYGTSYKAEYMDTVGSPSILLRNLLEARGVKCIAPIVMPYGEKVPPAIYIIGTKYDVWPVFDRGSVVIDPWGIIPDLEGVTVVRLGRKGGRG